MKTLLLTLTLLTSSLVSAKDIAHYRFAVRDNTNNEIISINARVTTDKELIIDGSTVYGQGPIYFPGPIRVIPEETMVLSDLAFQNIERKIIGLAKTEIEVRTQHIVCMVMPSPEMSNNHLSVPADYDYETNEFSGDMTLVSGPSGCWVRQIVQPKAPYMATEAKGLKETLKILSLQTLR